MIFGNYFTSITYTVMTDPRFEKQIESVDEILSNAYELVGDEFALHHLMQQNEVSFNKNAINS